MISSVSCYVMLLSKRKIASTSLHHPAETDVILELGFIWGQNHCSH